MELTAEMEFVRHDAADAGPRLEAFDALELEVCSIWAQILDIPAVRRGDNFFDLGGTSPKAVSLWLTLQQRFGVEIALGALLSSSSVSAMAELIRTGPLESEQKCLVPIRSAGTRAPLFCFHPLTGTVTRYGSLAAAMPADQPVYALQSRGLDPRLEFHRSIPEMAAAYVEEMLTVEQDGPFLLLGYSMGGTVAYEVARQLRVRGAEIGMLAMIDTASTTDGEYDPVDYVIPLFMENGLKLTVDPASILELDMPARIDTLLGLGKDAGSIPASYGVDQLRRMIESYGVNSRAAQDYRIEDSAERIVMFRSDDPGEPANGWDNHVKHVTVIPIPGGHFDVMEPAGARLIADAVTAICRAQGERRADDEHASGRSPAS